MGAQDCCRNQRNQCMYISMGYFVSDTLTETIGSRDSFLYSRIAQEEPCNVCNFFSFKCAQNLLYRVRSVISGWVIVLYLTVSLYLMWMFVMDTFKLLMIVLMRESSHDELFYSPQKIT